MKVPMACPLTADAATDRIEEWLATLATSVISAARPAANRLDLHLRQDPVRVTGLIDLACREKACCDFFDFTINIEAAGPTLVAKVPPFELEVARWELSPTATLAVSTHVDRGKSATSAPRARSTVRSRSPGTGPRPAPDVAPCGSPWRRPASRRHRLPGPRPARKE
jgi:hypothetical protein